MRQRQIVIIGSPRDHEVEHVGNILAVIGHRVAVVPLDSATADDVETHSLRLIHGQRPRAFFGQTELLETDAVWTTTQAAATRSGDRAAMVDACLDLLAADRRAVLNPPTSVRQLTNRPALLARLAVEGMPVPDTIVTDDPATAMAFASGRVASMTSSVDGEAPRLIDGGPDTCLPLPRSGPTLVEVVAPGDHVRIIVLDGRVVSSVLPPRNRSVDLPERIESAAIAAARLFGLRFAGIDVSVPREDPERFVIRDVVSSPAFLEIELATGHKISEALAAALAAPVRRSQPTCSQPLPSRCLAMTMR